MRVLVATSSMPFVAGGNVVIARELVDALRRSGHESDLLITPSNPFGSQISAYAANWLTRVTEDGLGRPIDRLVTFRYPSFALRHPRHICWLNHRLREYYDLWGRVQAGWPRRFRYQNRLKRMVLHRFDKYLLNHNVRKLYVQSGTIKQRVERWGHHHQAEVLYPPPPFREYRLDVYGNYIFAISRLEHHKRIDLIIRALAACRTDVRLKIAGGGNGAAGLLALTRELQLENRVEFLGEINEAEKLYHYANCRLVYFAPFYEDYGFVTLEAFASSKAVITTTDSGGPAELVKSGETGIVTAPDPVALAREIDTLWEERGMIERLGHQAAEFARPFCWENIVDRFVSLPLV
jgi:glycosyltransferase involved in cell wall biosynthesis